MLDKMMIGSSLWSVFATSVFLLPAPWDARVFVTGLVCGIVALLVRAHRRRGLSDLVADISDDLRVARTATPPEAPVERWLKTASRVPWFAAYSRAEYYLASLSCDLLLDGPDLGLDDGSERPQKK